MPDFPSLAERAQSDMTDAPSVGSQDTSQGLSVGQQVDLASTGNTAGLSSIPTFQPQVIQADPNGEDGVPPSQHMANVSNALSNYADVAKANGAEPQGKALDAFAEYTKGLADIRNMNETNLLKQYGFQLQGDELEKQRANHKDLVNKIQSQDDDIQSQIADSKLDPNRFWHNQGTFGSLMGALAIGMGAYGSAITGSPNAAMQIIDGAINRDIDAQKNDISRLHMMHQMNSDALSRINDQETHDMNLYLGSMRGYNEMYQTRLNTVLGQLQASQQYNPKDPVFQAKMQGTIQEALKRQADTRLTNAKADMEERQAKIGKPLSEGEFKQLSNSKNAINTLQSTLNEVNNNPNIVTGPLKGVVGVFSKDQAAFNTKLQSNLTAAAQVFPVGRQKTLLDSLVKQVGAGKFTTTEQLKGALQTTIQSLTEDHNSRIQANQSQLRNTQGLELQQPKQQVQSTQPSMEGKTATNPKTGQRIMFKGGQWQPVQ